MLFLPLYHIIKSYLIAGALPSIIFPIVGLITSFIYLTAADDYVTCYVKEKLKDDDYDDHMKHVMRSYACWYYAYAISNPYRSLKLIFSLLYHCLQTLQVSLSYQWSLNANLHACRLRYMFHEYSLHYRV